MKQLVSVIFAATILTAGIPVHAQQKQPPDSMQVLQAKLKADRKLLVSQNMMLSDEQAQKFWPLYEGYVRDLTAINARLLTLIKDYAKAYNANTLNDTIAKKLTDEMLSIEDAEVQMRKNYAKKIASALSPTVAARYLQLENKLRALVRYELAEQIPLLP